MLLKSLLELDEAQEVPECHHHAFTNMIPGKLLCLDDYSIDPLTSKAASSVRASRSSSYNCMNKILDQSVEHNNNNIQ